MDNAILNFGHITNGNVMEFSKVFGHSGWKRTKSDKNEEHSWYDKIEIKNNSSGFRCDDFMSSKSHNGLHIIFAGCSVTWGDALNQEDTWPAMVYSEISKEQKTSGYFNLGFPGTSIVQQIFWMMKYFNKYGNPDYVFFLMPNLGRFMSVDPDTLNVGSSIMYSKDQESYPGSLELVKYFEYEIYSMFEQYCKSNSITLISSSWSFGEEDNNAIGRTTNLFIKDFDTFFGMLGNGVDPMQWIYEYMQKDKSATIKAIDGTHPGKAEQAYYASRMLDRYREIKNENIRV